MIYSKFSYIIILFILIQKIIENIILVIKHEKDKNKITIDSIIKNNEIIN